MAVALRPCAGPVDFPAISDFLYSLYQPDNRDGNWLQPIWEYAYTHPLFDEESVPRIGIWEDNGTMVGVVLYQSRLGEASFPIHPDYMYLKPGMMAYAEQHLTALTEEGKQYLKVWVKDFDAASERLVRSRGYERQPRSDWSMLQFVITEPFPPIHLPEGFRLKSVAEENDLAKIDRVLWRGFNHPGEPPEASIEGRRKMQSGPNFRKDLTMVVEAPNGAFAAFAGLWFDPVNEFGYVEPVATDPDYRRMGLGTAAVLEGIRRCGELGATVAYVGIDKPFYRAMGFQKLHTSHCWVKWFSGE
ncbi:MAG: GNAT family N-acetyltransferase [Anaerolineae bacterium]|jgi:predicted N-acetyltransferase YhbS